MDITMALVSDINAVFEALGWGTPNFHTGAAPNENAPPTHFVCYIPMTDEVKLTLENAEVSIWDENIVWADFGLTENKANAAMNVLRITWADDNIPERGAARLDVHLGNEGLVRITPPEQPSI